MRRHVLVLIAVFAQQAGTAHAFGSEFGFGLEGSAGWLELEVEATVQI